MFRFGTGTAKYSTPAVPPKLTREAPSCVIAHLKALRPREPLTRETGMPMRQRSAGRLRSVLSQAGISAWLSVYGQASLMKYARYSSPSTPLYEIGGIIAPAFPDVKLFMCGRAKNCAARGCINKTEGARKHGKVDVSGKFCLPSARRGAILNANLAGGYVCIAK